LYTSAYERGILMSSLY